MPEPVKKTSIESLRSFNRFHTAQIGVLHEGLLNSKFPLAEARVIYELAARGEATAKELCHDLSLDPGYLSRMIRGLTTKGLVVKHTVSEDRRKSNLSLTDAGKAEFAILNADSIAANARLLEHLTEQDQDRLTEAMTRIQTLLSPVNNSGKTFMLRPHRPGDMGKVISLHGSLYVEQFGWDHTFEALVAKISAEFLDNFDPETECSWIAEVDGEFVGSAFVVRVDDKISKLRLMIIDQKAQGLGIGKALLNECLGFARRKGYKKMTLWTNDVLTAARNMYAKAGFEMIDEEPGRNFGVDLVSEIWELDL
ncbi:MAG: MarR family transcriptional regulator [Alphaproteobacteria bacterium]|jgi:DNA-binding MarR family transcriptional regulator/GNAT superfamily N-acetyltransferase|nr:MarR family transcriptional regulator [Alphaproteobacteria bacterium]MBT4019665.1 MarR family transcriptional regulator [Alphaproteobacteria bacterium]MBT4967066.1 MarR family transcriptional regulator [Alphaproteobacteria bacterium]MBT5161816.1 MarR family transcriptional regulator [Alphaproteobacteria bacterium]